MRGAFSHDLRLRPWTDLLCSRQGFGRGNNKNNNNNNNNSPKMNNGAAPQAPAPVAYAPQPGPMPNSPSVASTLSIENAPPNNNDDTPKYFFQEKYAPLNVKGNFLTLCACPKNVELGEWLAHQSMYLLLSQC